MEIVSALAVSAPAKVKAMKARAIGPALRKWAIERDSLLFTANTLAGAARTRRPG
jgi:hypothetical protein